MASNLSEEEFQRLQEQLIELRTTNYSLDEQCKKLKLENGQLTAKFDNVEKELLRANKTINRSKKMKEVEVLLGENHSLQLKLQAQEDEFRLQNQTLLQELALLVASNEELEKRVPHLQPVNTSSDSDSELLRVKAEYLALQEAMTLEKARAEKEIKCLQETLQTFHVDSQIDQTDQPQPINCSSEDGDYVELHNAEVSYQKRNGSLAEPLKLAQEKIKILEGDLKELIDVRLLLETERVEKQLVQGELGATQANIQQLQEKLDSKQAALLQLHNEKEQLYLHSKKQIEELEIRKEVEVRTLREHNQRLQTQLNKCQSALQESKERVTFLESTLTTVQQQSTESTEKQIGEMKAELDAALHDKSLLQQQFTSTSSRANELAINLEQVTQELQQTTKVSEKRKSLLDEISTTLQQKCDDLQKQLDESIQENSKIISELRNQLKNSESEVARLSRVEKDLEEAKVQVQSLEAQRGWLERTQQEAELSHQQAREQLESYVEQLKAQHTQHVESVISEFQTKEQELNAAVAEAREAMQEKQQQVLVLQQQVNDAAGERRLIEKKGVVVTRDLRRQLASERRRVEKLQDRLRELNSENKVNSSLTDMNHKPDGGKDADTSSISSWSIMSGTLEPRGSSTREGSLVAGSPTNGNDHVAGDADLEQENFNLVARITALQQEKWVLEERINHLEEGSASMVDELMRKTALINFYCMEGGKGGSANLAPSKLTRKSLSDIGGSPERFSGVLSDKLSMKKFKDLLKPSSDEYSPDSHRRMQRMLEETLTKNMHLQADLEKLSKENERLTLSEKTAGPEKS